MTFLYIDFEMLLVEDLDFDDDADDDNDAGELVSPPEKCMMMMMMMATLQAHRRRRRVDNDDDDDDDGADDGVDNDDDDNDMVMMAIMMILFVCDAFHPGAEMRDYNRAMTIIIRSLTSRSYQPSSRAISLAKSPMASTSKSCAVLYRAGTSPR